VTPGATTSGRDPVLAAVLALLQDGPQTTRAIASRVTWARARRLSQFARDGAIVDVSPRFADWGDRVWALPSVAADAIAAAPIAAAPLRSKHYQPRRMAPVEARVEDLFTPTSSRVEHPCRRCGCPTAARDLCRRCRREVQAERAPDPPPPQKPRPIRVIDGVEYEVVWPVRGE
jgi:hypothetical protein